MPSDKTPSNANGPPPPVDPNERFFATDHLREGLSSRSARGGVVTIASQGTKFALQMISTTILARILTPSDFGLVAMVATFTGLVGLFKDMGLSMATVQKAKITQGEVSALFWTNVLLSLAVGAGAALLAPAVSTFYDKPELVAICFATAGALVLDGLGNQHIALIRRQMRFDVLAKIQVAAMICAITASISLALSGAGYWALVALKLTEGATTTILSIAYCPWRPGKPNFGKETLGLLKFGGQFTVFSFVNYFTRNADNFLIGRYLGAAALGLYSKAYALVLLPMQQINGPIAAVAVPALSRLQDDTEALKAYFLRMVQVIAYLSMPPIVLLGILAEETVLLLLGDQWIESAIIFQIFAIAVVAQSIANTNGWLLTALGQTGRLLKLGSVSSTCTVLAFVIGLQWGIRGVATAATINGLLIVIPAARYTYAKSPIRGIDVLKQLLHPMLLASVVLVVSLGTRQLLLDQSFLIRGGVSGTLAGAAAIATIYLNKTIKSEFIEAFKQLKRKS